MSRYYHLAHGDRIATPHGALGRIVGYSEPDEIGDPCWISIRWDDGIITDHPASEIAHWTRSTAPEVQGTGALPDIARAALGGTITCLRGVWEYDGPLDVEGAHRVLSSIADEVRSAPDAYTYLLPGAYRVTLRRS